MAAATLASLGRRVILLERLSRPGQKLLATGGGRCNLAHDLAPAAFIRAFSRNHAPVARFIAPAIHHFPPAKIRQWFHDRGVPTCVQPDGCVYPVSNSSRDILDALLRACDHPLVELRTHTRVINITPNVAQASRAAPRFQLTTTNAAGVVETLCGGSLILATGGCSCSPLGADPSILKILANLGLAIVPPVPALVPLVVDKTQTALLSLAGLTLENARVAWQGSASATDGAVLFTHRGLSGPAILEISRDFPNPQIPKSPNPQIPKSPTLQISTCAARGWNDWQTLFASWRVSRGATFLRNLLSGEIPRPWAAFLCDAAGLPASVTAARATRGNLDALATALTALPIPISETEGWSRAMVTRGGVALHELDPQTLRCHRFPFLHCIGDGIDNRVCDCLLGRNFIVRRIFYIYFIGDFNRIVQYHTRPFDTGGRRSNQFTDRAFGKQV